MSEGLVDYLDAFMKTAQYLAGLTTQQDVWSETAKLLVNSWNADLGGFGERDSNGKTVIQYVTSSPALSDRMDLVSEVHDDVVEVLDSGFLTWRLISTSTEPLLVALFPVTQRNQVVKVLLAGHKRSGLLPNNLLDTYLALAGLVGTTAERLASELRLREKTAQLAKTNRELEKQIAERKRAEEFTIAERQRLYDILETMPVMVCLLTTDHHVAFANRGFREKFGEDSGRPCYDYRFGLKQPCGFCESFKVLQTGQPHHWEIISPDGSFIDVYDFPFTDSDGSPLVLEIDIDITEQRRAQEAARVERQRLYDVLETLPVYVCLLDSDYFMPFANRYFRENFGESLGRRCYEFLFNRTEPCETCETYTVMKTRSEHYWNWTGPNGREYDVYDFPYIDQDGSMLILEMGIDITERKQAEKALNETLADLTRSNEDLQQFAYVASHDLQEPLRNVAGCLQLLEKKYKNRLDADADKYIYYAIEGAVRMKALILDLLAYSRIGTRSKPIRPVDCQQILAQTLGNLASAISETGAAITHDPLPTVPGDDIQLLQVFQNLIQNAIKFRRNTSPQIHVSAVKDKSGWRFSIRDNGLGMESRHLDRIFVIFQRLNKRREYDGTGIGLAVVKKVIERHGGRIWVQSEPGVGTTFYFTIPEKRLQNCRTG